MPEVFNATGVIAGLAAAACWAGSGLLYVRVPLGAGGIATYKNCLGMLLMLGILSVRCLITGTPVFQASSETWIYLSLSGVLGLSLADIAYFRSLQILGAQKGMTLTLLTPISTAVLGMLYLGEQLTIQQASFILLTLLGIGMVMRDQSEKTAEQDIRPGSVRWGVACALFGIATVAGGSVLLKAGTSNVDSLEGAFIRLLSASASGVIYTIVMREAGELRQFIRQHRPVLQLSTACFIGTVMGVWLMLLSFKHCTSAMASTLTSTSPLFVMLFALAIYKRKITLQAAVGAVVAVGGVCLLLLNVA